MSREVSSEQVCFCLAFVFFNRLEFRATEPILFATFCSCQQSANQRDVIIT